MRHVITGGSGFTGQVLARLLASREASIVNFDLVPPGEALTEHAQVGYVQGDVTSADDLARLGLGPDDVVYHLAARQFGGTVPRRDRDAWFSAVNVTGTERLVSAMTAGGACRLVFFSTDMTYGIPDRCPVFPDHPQRPLGPYGRSKLAAERVIREAEGLRSTIFRPRLINGPGRLGILSKLFRLIAAGLPVPMIGSGTNRYQMVGVEDCARAALLAVDAGCPAGPFNLGSQSPPTTRALLEAVIRHAGSRSVLVPVPTRLLKPVLGGLDRFGLTLLYPEQFSIADKDVLLDTGTTRSVLGWTPLREDTAMMIAAYDAFLRPAAGVAAARI